MGEKGKEYVQQKGGKMNLLWKEEDYVSGILKI